MSFSTDKVIYFIMNLSTSSMMTNINKIQEEKKWNLLNVWKSNMAIWYYSIYTITFDNVIIMLKAGRHHSTFARSLANIHAQLK